MNGLVYKIAEQKLPEPVVFVMIYVICESKRNVRKLWAYLHSVNTLILNMILIRNERWEDIVIKKLFIP